MLKYLVLLVSLWCTSSGFTQGGKVVIIGSSSAAGVGSNPLDSSWVSRFNYYYKRQNKLIDTTYNLSVAGYSVYQGLPGSYQPPANRPSPEGAHNVSQAVLDEFNASSFVIEASADGVTFSEIGRLPARGNGRHQTKYAFNHAVTADNTFHYYRIREIGTAGRPLYSPVQSIRLPARAKTIARVLINPVRQNLQLSVYRPCQAVICDMSGQIVWKGKLAVGPRGILMSGLAPGKYRLTIRDGGYVQSQ